MPGYHNFYKGLMDGEIDLDANTIKVALCTSSYTPNIDHDFFDDITNEVSGTGYTAGGATLGTKAITDDDSGDKAYFDAADVTWSTSTITARYAIVYKDTGTASTSPLIGYIDFGEDKESSGADFVIQWHANGIVSFANA